jgi:hypothetical protein
MDMLGVVAIDTGLTCVLLGFISVYKPLRFIGIKSRKRAAIMLLCGIGAMVIGDNLPVTSTRVPAMRTRLDEFAPIYQFHERHTTVVEASRERVYAAVKTVEPDEILGFRTLTWMRRLGRQGAENILNPPAHQPILETAVRTGFIPLADDREREVVFGLVMTPLLPVSKPTPETYKKLDRPLTMTATMNFRIEPIDAYHCRLTTETRMYSRDIDAQRLFAMYWRLIYPGSAMIRRMWLRAIRKRAESPDTNRPAKATT